MLQSLHGEQNRPPVQAIRGSAVMNTCIVHGLTFSQSVVVDSALALDLMYVELMYVEGSKLVFAFVLSSYIPLQAVVETVIKVSGKQSKEDKEKKEAEKEAAETAEQERAEKELEAKQKEEDDKEKAKQHIWNFGKSSQEKEREREREKEKEKRERDKQARAQAPQKLSKHATKKQEASTEQEVDRIIDSKDNVYVLSKPK